MPNVYKNVTNQICDFQLAITCCLYYHDDTISKHEGCFLDSGTNIDLQSIARKCGLFDKTDTNTVIRNIENLQSEYKEDDLVCIYNYMLKNAQTPEVIMELIHCVDMFRDKSSLEYLVDILLLKNANNSDNETKEKFTNVRIMCAKAIANQKNTDVVSSLLYCLNNKDENYRVRLACADALGKIGNKYAVAPLIEVAQDENEKSTYLRESAVTALGLLGDTRAIDPLVSILETKQGIMDKFTFLKERAIEALTKMGFNDNERVFRALKSSLDDESAQVRINAIEAIMDSEHPDAYKVIKNCLDNDNNLEVKKNAMIALYNLSDRGILDEIIKSQDYPDQLKIEAVSIIEEYENEE